MSNKLKLHAAYIQKYGNSLNKNLNLLIRNEYFLGISWSIAPRQTKKSCKEINFMSKFNTSHRYCSAHRWNGIIAKFQSFFIEWQTHSHSFLELLLPMVFFLWLFVSYGCCFDDDLNIFLVAKWHTTTHSQNCTVWAEALKMLINMLFNLLSYIYHTWWLLLLLTVSQIMRWYWIFSLLYFVCTVNREKLWIYMWIDRHHRHRCHRLT